MTEGANSAEHSVPDLSVVIPVYACRECLVVLHERLSKTLRSAVTSYEIIFIDDRSPDGAWAVLQELAKTDVNVRAVRLSRNFGQHAAITAGLAHSSARRVVVMDCDLQDPPEEIPRLIAKADSGYDIVFARRMAKKHSRFRKLAARVFFRLINAVTAARLHGDYGSFSLLSRKVVDSFLRFHDVDRHYIFILAWLGYRTGEIEYHHADRFAGASAYDLRKLLSHALSGFFFQTTVLLRWVVYLGFAFSSAGALLACYFVYLYFFHNVLPGWTSLIVLLLIVGGFIILSTGVTGLYIGKIFEQGKGRPLFVVDEVAGENAVAPNRDLEASSAIPKSRVI